MEKEKMSYREKVIAFIIGLGIAMILLGFFLPAFSKQSIDLYHKGMEYAVYEFIAGKIAGMYAVKGALIAGGCIVFVLGLLEDVRYKSEDSK